VLLDEPFAGVDAENSEVLCQCIKKLIKENITFIIIEHKMQLLENIINKEIKLNLGKLEK
jgi:ABC-type branched-subunit amino acid transport system ATPase component